MRFTKILSVLIILLVSTGVLFAGGEQEKTPPISESAGAEDVSGAGSISIVDYSGKEVSIKLPIKRAVVLDPDAILVIKAIGAEKQIAGIGKMSAYMEPIYPYLTTLPQAGEYTSPDVEGVVALEPDLILFSYITPDDLDNMIGSEIPIVRLRFADPVSYKENVETMGRIFGREKEAHDFIAWYEGILSFIKEGVESIETPQRPRVFEFYGGEYGMGDGPPYGSFGSNNPFGTPILSMVGARNITGDIPGDWIVVDSEWLVTENPDVIIREIYGPQIGMDAVGYKASNSEAMAALLNDIKALPEFENSSAVKNDRVYLIDGELRHTPWFLGVPYVAKWLYPDIFAELDPNAIHQEFLTSFLRIDYDVSKQGVFVYPEQ